MAKISIFKAVSNWLPAWLTGADAHVFFGMTIALIWPSWWMFVISQPLFLLKEFWFDKHYETTPQTFKMNLIDWATYTVGTIAGVLVFHFKYRGF